MIGKFLFQTRAWWAKQLRIFTAHFTQLSKMRCCGRLNSRAIFFLTELSLRLQNSLERVPKDVTSSVFQTGGISGSMYFSLWSVIKSSLQRANSCLIDDRHCSWMFLSLKSDESINPNAPYLMETWCIIYDRKAISMDWTVAKITPRNSLSKE